MITEYGYSKDPNIVPEGIVVTFGKETMIEQGGYRTFIRGWKNCMDSDDTWMHFCSKIPTQEVAFVYIIILNRLAYRVNFIGWEPASTMNAPRYMANGEIQPLNKPGILICGPAIKCPFKRTLKGFQGFRYSTKLF